MAAKRPRRGFLLTASSALLAGLAGCQSPPASSSPPAGSATPTGSRGTALCADEVTPPSRTNADGQLLVRDYPTIPEELTRESAAEYATAYEEAHQMNRLARQSSASAYEVKEVFDRQSTIVDEGAVVSFEMNYAWKTESGERTVDADATVAVTYFVSQRTVIRQEGSTDADPRKPDVGEVVVCRVDG